MAAWPNQVRHLVEGQEGIPHPTRVQIPRGKLHAGENPVAAFIFIFRMIE